MRYQLVDIAKTIAGVSARWKQQYEKSTSFPTSQRGLQYAKLVALDSATATPEAIKAIIGNESWTQTRCSFCDRCDSSSEFFEEIVSASADCQAIICFDCIKAMFVEVSAALVASMGEVSK